MKNNRTQFATKIRKLFISFSLFLTSLTYVSVVNASLLLEVDLSVENTISINATDGASLITASGSDFTGIYLDGFFGSNNLGGIDENLVAGDLTSANNSSNFVPNLFHFSNDPGLNIFEVSSDSSLSFTQGALAFVGSATWTIGENFYQHFLSSASSGKIFFPADDISDTNSASVLGTWSVVNASVDVPEPSMAALLVLGVGLMGFARKTQ
ncbi:PEP-CTERM sorting domain-containing protein [Aliiglaciecola sp. M165]|uniref:PEP-CTERM sorting domain-containing protein n=1 Tax=Aliiglaciecola sp. M165 TaxID=2593649 RepID=UPI00117C4DDB|nr:PEP-CTERM sorting domain-containing protein [Aliiglaciecola sp. M165]TRY30143.1 PEP-CTERM sorting domain-containing protein [Aliiglaciecola sp. M165]